MKKLFVGGLPFAYNDDELRNIFQGFELASAIIIKDKFTGRSKGFGFVELADDQMEAAIAKCNGMDVEGRSLTVNEARPMEKRAPGGFGGGNRDRRPFGGGRDKRGGFSRNRW